MSDRFFRFPRTPHIVWPGEDTPRDDKILTPPQVEILLAEPIVVEEKLDGANIGFSVAADGRLRVQNRGQYLVEPFAGQFERLPCWLTLHQAKLRRALGKNLIAFGEWCAARHSLEYTGLPDWWLLFDIYDRQKEEFWSSVRRDTWAKTLGLAVVPRVTYGLQSVESLQDLVQQECSRYREGGLEGIVARAENERWLQSRAKMVRPDFVQNIGPHWSRRKLEWNRVDWSAHEQQTQGMGRKILV